MLRNMNLTNVLTVCLITQVVYYAGGTSILKCKCQLDIQKFSADCSGLGLTNVSDVIKCLPSNMRELNFFNNSLQYIPPNIFSKFSFLEDLRLDYNNIEYLRSGTFDGLSMLEHLSLDYNNLNHNNSYVDDIFTPLQNLRRLNLQGNCNVHISKCSNPDKALSEAISLQYLHLDGIPDFGPGFTRLKNLYSLYFSDTNGYCYFPVLTENTFESFRHTPLSYLQLDKCNIRNLEPNVFRGLRNLTTLIIIYNKRLCSDSIDNATLGLNETNIEKLQFNDWCIGTDPPAYISLSQGMLKGLTNTSLKTLDLRRNYIIYVDPGCIANLPKTLEYLSFKENKIDDAKFMKRLKTLENLETLDFSYQYHYDIKRPSSKNMDGFVQNLNTSDKIFGTKIRDHGKTVYAIYLPKNIRTIYINDIKLKYPVPPLTFGPNKLKYLDASSCMLTAFLGPWYGLKDLQYCDLSSNSFTAFSPNSLIDMGNLTTLLLHNNQIAGSLYMDTDGQTFSSQKKLEVLNLSTNAIKDLPYDIFKNQIKLRNLSLADNSMENVSFSLKAMTKLQYLDLSGNQIEYLSNENMEFLDQVAATENIRVNLSGNILSCMCDNQQFINWLATTKVNIINRDKLQCLYRNNTVVSLSMIDVLKLQLGYECLLWIIMTSCVTGFVGLLLVFSFVALLYHKRWQLRYLWYIGRIKIDPYHHPDDQQETLLEIDAYISYEQHYDITDDVTLHQIITDRMYPFFEDRGYTLKIREEFLGNDKLYHVIPEIVRKSRKVIVLLTPAYCKDYWNTFEFNIAAYEGIYTKRSVIVPILIGDICEKDLTPEIRSFVHSKGKSNEVLRFPSPTNYEHHIDAFIEQLEYRIRS